MNDTISVLVAARKNSKYLAKFLFGYFATTHNPERTEVLVMLNADDTWNTDLVDYYENHTNYPIRFFREDHKLGRAGLHIYFNELYQYASGQWIVYFCEDHYIIQPGWDAKIRMLIDGLLVAKKGSPNQPDVRQNKLGPLDPTKIWAIIPKFDNAGAMNHILSRGFIEQQGAYLAQHGNLDSYINFVITRLPRERKVIMDAELFHDFTHDQPSPMADSHMQSVISDEGKKMPRFESREVEKAIDEDVQKLHTAIGHGF